MDTADPGDSARASRKSASPDVVPGAEHHTASSGRP